MGSPFDLFSEMSHPDSREVTDEQYENRIDDKTDEQDENEELDDAA